MNDREREHLFAAVDEFLRGTAHPPAMLDPVVDRALAFWRRRPFISTAEIDLLIALQERPARAETVAGFLGRDLRATQDFLHALTTVGVLERYGDRYHTTPAVARYLVAVRDGQVSADGVA